jgi:hypothetical protein
MQRSRTLLVLSGLFIAMAAALAVQDQLLQSTPPAEAPSAPLLARVFPDLSVLDIISIRLLDPVTSTDFTIVRDSAGSWVSADGSALEENAGTNIARTIALLPSTRTVRLPENGDLTPFGFAPNGLLFVQVLLTNGEGHAVAIGGVTPNMEGHYALVDDQAELHVLLTEAVAYLISVLRDPPLA